MFHDVLEKLSCVGMLHDKVQFIVGLDYLVQLDYVQMPDFLENLDLSGYHIYVLLVLDFALLQDLDRNLLLGNGMGPELHLSKGAFAQCLLYQEVRYLLQLGRGRRRRQVFGRSTDNKLLEFIFLLLQLALVTRHPSIVVVK